MYKTKSFFTVVIVLTTLFTSCKKDEEIEETKQSLEIKTVTNLAADPTTNSSTGQPQAATGFYTLYSLKENSIVSNSDSATSKWDIGFRGTSIIVNGGSIRTGKGGVYLHTGTFEELKVIPENQAFSTDESTSSLALSGTQIWYNYNPTTHVISAIPGKILVLKTGDGKYAKIEILSYYKDSPASPSETSITRYYTFRFIYQPSGSKSFN